MMHVHRWGQWADVAVQEVVKGPILNAAFVIAPVQVIKQQRRCSVCNLVKTRIS